MIGRREPLPVRIYRALVRVLPEGLREHHGREVGDTFLDQYRETRRVRGWGAAAWLWLRSTGLLAACAIQARRDRANDDRTNGRGEPMGDFLQDLGFGVRSVLKRPGFSATAVLVLAVGIGATTTIFSVVDTVVLREMPYPDAGRLIHFDNGSHSFPSFRAWRELDSFESVVAAMDQEVDLTGEGAPQRLPAAAVSEAFFASLGAAPHLGRLFDAGDYPGDRSVTVLGHGAWRRLFGGDPGIVGRTVRIDGSPSTIVGVLSPSFEAPSLETGSRVDFWFALGDGGDEANEHGYHVLGIVGRLHPGSSLEAAQAEVTAQREAVAREFPRSYVNTDGSVDQVPLVPLREATVRHVSATLYLLLGAVGLMLLIACANVANLFLARGTSRTREIALRSALGAGRGRLASLVLVESLLVALAGGILGAAIAYGGVELFTRFQPGGIPRIDTLAVDTRVLAFTLTASLATGLLFGLIPALQAAAAPVNEAIKDTSASASPSRAGRRTRNALVVSEIGIAMVLLVAAGLLFRTFSAMTSVDPGFRSDGITVLSLSLEANYTEEERLAFVDRLTEMVRAMPGTEAVAVGWTSPFRMTGGSRCCWRTGVEGDPALVNPDAPFRSIIHPVTDGYFATLGAPVTRGRELDASDMTSGVPVAVLNEPAARGLFGDADPIGRTILLRGHEPVTVVGVVAGVHHWGLSQPVEQGVYVPYGQYGGMADRVDMIVRSSAAQESLAAALREAVWEVDPALPIGDIASMEQRIGVSVATPRFLSMMFSAFAAVSLLLACAGIYGSMLYTVGQRRREMGIRLALGARGSAVVRMVMAHGAVVTAVGVLLGVGASLAASRLMTSLIWGVEPTDAATFVGVAASLAAAAMAACAFPAWRASRTDPLETLRSE